VTGASPAAVDAVIVGAGMAGVTAARSLRAAGLRTVVLEKGRVAGGRMATRRIDGARFDHGAQHFSARSRSFRELVDALSAVGVVREWFRSQSLTRPERGVEVRHAAVEGMRTIVEHLSAGLDVRTSTVVARLRRDGRRIAVIADGFEVTARAVVLTPPLPQCLDLLTASRIGLGHAAKSLGSVSYDACLAVMAVLDGPSGLPNGHLAVDGEPVAWLADNQHKGVSTEPAVTIHGTPSFSAAHIEDEPARWVRTVATAAKDHLAAEIVSVTGHRWRYAQPRTTLDTGCAVIDAGAPIVLSGEVFAGARVEGAYLSAAAAAAAVLERLG
jgi:renalase